WASDRTKRVFAWLRQVCADDRQPANAFRLAFILVDKYVNTQGIAWPSQLTLALDMGITPRGVRKLLDGLVAGGHLEVQSGKGRKVTSTYRPLVKPLAEPAGGSTRRVATKRAPYAAGRQRLA